MSNSPLVNVTLISPNKNSPRNHAIDTITIHCFVGQVTAKRGCEVFLPTSKEASCNYVVGYDGQIGLCVDEADRSWCTSNAPNDQRAITIEVASDTTEPYAVTPDAYKALIKLVADICKRNGIKQLVWSTDKNTRVNHLNGCNMTVHRDYANKSCPGAYLYERMGMIASEVNDLLKDETAEGKEMYDKIVKYLNSQPLPEWAKKEYQEAIEMGITDGSSPMTPVPRYQAAIMAKRAAQK